MTPPDCMIVLLVPTHNEVENVPRLLKSWREHSATAKYNLRFCFVDDGSTDGTREFLLSAGSDVELVRQDPCQGPGAAFQRGFNYLLPSLGENDVLVTLEADNTSDLKIVDRMFDELAKGADLVLAACYAKGGGIVGTTPMRIFLSAVANRLLKIIFRLPHITTFTSFYRAWRPELLRRISDAGEIRLRLRGFVCMAELLLLAAVADARIVEVPMLLEGFQRKGASKMKVFRTIREYGYFLVVRAPLWLRRWGIGTGHSGSGSR